MVFPPISWAQRKNVVFITIALSDATNVELTVGEALIFRCVSQAVTYDCHVPLFAPVLPDQSSSSTTAREVRLTLQKSEPAWWPRLTQTKAKYNIVIDWTRWVDEDDEDQDKGLPQGQDEFGGLNEMQQMMARAGLDGSNGIPAFGSAAGQQEHQAEEDEEDGGDDEGPPPLED